jgi:hypothetical protein
MFRKSIITTFIIAMALNFFHSSPAVGADPIFSDDFESGNLAAWSGKKTDSGDLAVAAFAALEGARGIRVRIDDNTPIYLVDDSTVGEVSYKAKFLFDPNSIRMADGDAHTIFLGQDLRGSTYVAALIVQLRKVASGYQLRAGARQDQGVVPAWINTRWFAITDQSHQIEVEWDTSQSAGMNNGQLAFSIDSIERDNFFTLDNDTIRIDRVLLGAVSGIDTTTRGVYFFDLFESFD